MATSDRRRHQQHATNNEPIIRRRPVPSRRRRDGLLKYARDYTSQNGEDGVIARLFDLIPATNITDSQRQQQQQQQKRYCVDVGAWDGKHLSNTYSLLIPPGQHLEDEKNDNRDDIIVGNWKGVLIEADPQKFQELQTLQRPHGNICVNQAVVTVPPDSPHQLHTILQEHAPECPYDFDFLCVDSTLPKK